ncbi:sporulation integral membrane protein YtvI [Anaeromicropila herbilytica]|uniref:Permease n=1 Tax=Anaeromicropila herbilytica TaxID=2785025 RepID=A0A7R7EHC7_9FIRM|nr:sporulation integral membrane protein YtvI [Anaeromicropila herbilytica]BCN28767.1 permease [Anaeromicropila herbilytica]
MQDKRKIRIALIMLGATVFVFLTFRYLLPYVYPFILAYFLVVAIMPVVKFLNHKLKLPKSIGALITLLLLVVILCLILCFVGVKVAQQARMLIRNLPIYQSVVLSNMNDGCNCLEKIFELSKGTVLNIVQKNVNDFLISIESNIMPMMTEQTLSIVLKAVGVFTVIFIILLAVILIIQDLDSMKMYYENFIFYKELHIVISKLAEAGIAYLRAQGILMLITASICTGGLFLIGNKYALLIGIVIGIFDAFPVLGSGFILVPWAIILLLTKNIYQAAIILTVYLLCQLTRQFLEPKLLGNRIGIKPIFTLMSMYLGVNFFGVVGFILGPIALVLIIAIVKSLCPELEMKSIVKTNKNEKMNILKFWKKH